MRVDPEKLLAALKAKFRKPRDVLVALGFDQAMVSSVMPDNTVISGNGNRNGNGSGALRELIAGLRRINDQSEMRRSDHAKVTEFLDTNANGGRSLAELRSEFERLLAELASIDDDDMAKFHDHLETAAPFDERDRDDDQGADRRARDDEPDDDIESRLARMQKFLGSRGMPQDGIDEAIALARKALEGREGRLDEMEGDEMLRKNAMAGGAGGAATHAYDSFAEMFPDAGRLKVDLTAAEMASFNRLFPKAKKIGQGASAARQPTARDRGSFERMFPESARIREGVNR